MGTESGCFYTLTSSWLPAQNNLGRAAASREEPKVQKSSSGKICPCHKDRSKKKRERKIAEAKSSILVISKKYYMPMRIIKAK